MQLDGGMLSGWSIALRLSSLQPSYQKTKIISLAFGILSVYHESTAGLETWAGRCRATS